MKIGILTQYYPPEIGAPQARLSHLAKKLAERGHEVYVLTALPNYPVGRIYFGYGHLFHYEKQEGITIMRTWIYPTKRVEVIRRLIQYLSFAISSLAAGIFSLPRLDYLITESPPLFLGLSGFVLSRFKQARWIFNVSDLWLESAVRLGVLRDGWRLGIARRLESFCYRSAWLVTGQSQEILDDIQSRFPSIQTYHFSNGVDPTLFSPERRSSQVRKRLASESTCIAVYAGLHGIAQGLEQLLEAASKLEDLNDFLLVMIGDGPEKNRLMERSKTMGLTNVRFLDPVPHSDISILLASSDVALVPLKDRLPGAVPSKVYEAMSSGLPVVLAANGEAAQIVKDSEAGIVVSPGQISALAEALRNLVKDAEKRRYLGCSGRRAAVKRFDRNQIASGFIDFLEKEHVPDV